jgi:aspartyl-tRNA(Asn)/glutamyl-tRNA(Gln) amidotransferase subunit C
MVVDAQLIDQLANLSKLKFSAEEQRAMQADMEKMIDFVAKLNELNTTGVEPLRHMNCAVNAWRPDLVEPSIPRNLALQNAAQHDGVYFKVPKVIIRDN